MQRILNRRVQSTQRLRRTSFGCAHRVGHTETASDSGVRGGLDSVDANSSVQQAEIYGRGLDLDISSTSRQNDCRCSHRHHQHLKPPTASAPGAEPARTRGLLLHAGIVDRLPSSTSTMSVLELVAADSIGRDESAAE